jgi:hypothetical protein
MSLPISCTLGPSHGAARRRRWEALAEVGRPSARRLGHRLEIRYEDGPGVRNELEALAAAERDCCSFAKWRVSHGRGEVVLHVSADPERADDISAIAVLFGAD